eukprot:scaffold174128_cov40-Tisochrysis_lutea.AAC.1
MCDNMFDVYSSTRKECVETGCPNTYTYRPTSLSYSYCTDSRIPLALTNCAGRGTCTPIINEASFPRPCKSPPARHALPSKPNADMEHGHAEAVEAVPDGRRLCTCQLQPWLGWLEIAASAEFGF